MTKMHFDEFNPLDVLAAAATLQSGGSSRQHESSSEQEEEGTGESVPEDDAQKKPAEAPSKKASSGRPLTALRIPAKSQSVDHSYAFVDGTRLRAPESAVEDDGYCSRCSLDSPGQSSRSDADTNDQDVFSDTDLRSPTAAPSPAFKSPAGLPSPGSHKKQTPPKAVPYHRDTAQLKQLLTCPGAEQGAGLDELTGERYPLPEQPSPPVHTVMEPVDSWAADLQDKAEVSLPCDKRTRADSLSLPSKDDPPSEESPTEPPAPSSSSSSSSSSTSSQAVVAPAISSSSSSSVLIVRPSSSKDSDQFVIRDDLPPPPPVTKSPPQSKASPAHSWQLLGTLDSNGTLVSASKMVLAPHREAASSGQRSLLDRQTAQSPIKKEAEPLLLMKDSSSGLMDSPGGPSPMLSSAPILPSLSQPSKSDASKINIKISGSKVIDVTCLDDRGIAVKKQATSIGHLGSLTWQSLECKPTIRLEATPSPIMSSAPSTPRSGTPVSEGALTKRPYNRRGKVPGLKRSASVAALEEEGGEKSGRGCHSYVKRRRVKSGSFSSLELCQMKLSAQAMPRLHPLIDHDYCTFSAFSAEIQSSIIATTETKLRTEKKQQLPKKAARTKAARAQPEKGTEGLLPKKRKYTKKKLAALEEGRSEEEGQPPEAEPSVEAKPAPPQKSSKDRMLKMRNKKRLLEKKITNKYTPYKERPDKNYVKIPGSYQDDFVYYATCRTQKRLRKAVELPPELTKEGPNPKPGQVGGINVFDWYREMSRVDKTKFGVGTSVAAAQPKETSAFDDKPLLSEDKGSLMLPPATSIPQHDSEVLDLVMGLQNSPMEMDANQVSKVETVETSEDIDLMAEQVRSMLTSMNESDLRMLSENLGDANGDFVPEAPPTDHFGSHLGPAPPLGDLDDIKDSDLISSDMVGGDLHSMLGDLATSSVPPLQPNPPIMLDSLAPSGFVPPSLPRVDSFASSTGSTPSTPSAIASVSPDDAVPELTMVNMYWNDLPGLLINGKEYVRLVDIHKQVLPAKDTGILKKRCQMMGLEILNCSELQRDFLIRYMNAAKSKSCVITANESAKTLIGFYVDPRPRLPRQTTESETDNEVDEESTAKKELPPAPSPKSKESSDVGTKAVEAEPKESALIEVVDSHVEEEPPLPAAELPDRVPSPPVPTAPVKPPSTPKPRRESPPALVNIEVKRSARLRQTRKVSYVAMHNGISAEEEGTVAAEPKETPAEEPKVMVQLKVEDKPTPVNDPQPKPAPKVLGEEAEIRRLVNKRRRKGLSKKEVGRLLQLRERANQRRLKMRERKENRDRWAKRLARAKETLQQQSTQKPAEVLQEANAEQSWNAKVPVTNKEPLKEATAEDTVKPPAKKPATAKSRKFPPLQVTHRDHRNGHTRGKSQDGELFLDLYKTRDAACVLCSACREMMSVRKFLKHAHRLCDPDEIVAVTMPQKLEMTSCQPDTEEKDLWAEYETRAQQYEEIYRAREQSRQAKALADRELKKQMAEQPPAEEESPTTENSHTRHSTRLRKRKQLHPMESYVFAGQDHPASG